MEMRRLPDRQEEENGRRDIGPMLRQRERKGRARMRTLKILQAQMKVPVHKEEALAKAEAACEQAVREGAQLLTLPEMFCCPYETENFPLYGEEEGGRVWSRCSELARDYRLYLSAGSMPERGAEGRVYNTAYVFAPDGRQIAKHRKAHLFDINVAGGQYFKESDTLTAGNEVTVFDTEFGRMGLCVCYDFRFPELARLMVLRGAKVILVPAAFNMTTGPAHWELMFRAQAMFQQCFAVGTAPARDLSASYHSWGHSIVADPWGAVLCQMDEREGYQTAELDLEKVDAVREQIPLLRHRRIDLYNL